MKKAKPKTGTEKKESQIANQRVQLENSIGYLDDLVRTLRENLDPVLRVDEPEVAGSEENALPVQLAPLAHSFRELRHSVFSIKHIVDDILERLEL